MRVRLDAVQPAAAVVAAAAAASRCSNKNHRTSATAGASTAASAASTASTATGSSSTDSSTVTTATTTTTTTTTTSPTSTKAPTVDNNTHEKITVAQSKATGDYSHGSSEEEEEESESLIAVDDRMEMEEEDNSHVGQHPALKDMCVVNTSTLTRIVPNGPPAVLDNDCFHGHVMLLVRTPDVDGEDFFVPSADEAQHHHHPQQQQLYQQQVMTMGDIPKEVSQYFKNKKRRFEFQFQIRLKKVPTGALFLGCELEHAIKIGTLTKGLVGILLAMVRRINPGFHYSFGTADDVSPQERDKGNYEKTHLSFPVEASMDRIVITRPGDTPPKLGEELHETNESVKRRRKIGVGSVDWNLEDTYTMCLWSAYADWIKWKSLNVPGVAPFSLSRVTGTQPIYLSVYEITSTTASEYRKKRPPHKRQDLAVYTRLEFTNIHATRGGVAERILGLRPRNKRTGTNQQQPLLLLPHSSEMSLPDTESVDSDFETTSRVTC